MNGPQIQRFVCTETGRGKRNWTVQICGDRLKAIDPEGAEQFFTRQAMPEQLEYADLPGSTGVLTLKRGGRVTLQVPRRGVRPLRAWIGPPTLAMLKHDLKTSLGLGLAVGGFLIFTALPLAGGAEGGKLDVVGLVLGILVIAGCLLGRLLPRHEVFLLHAAFFVLLAADTTFEVVTGKSSPAWIALVVFCMFLIAIHLRKFLRFRKVDYGAGEGATESAAEIPQLAEAPDAAPEEDPSE